MFSCENLEEVLKEMKNKCEVPKVEANLCVQVTKSRWVWLDHSEWEDNRTELGDQRPLEKDLISLYFKRGF